LGYLIGPAALALASGRGRVLENDCLSV